MPTWLLYLAAAVCGYLWGSIPVGYLVGRRYGIDIRQHGSGNIGATNVTRTLGKRPGLFVFLCDACKGLLAVRCAYALVWRNFLLTSRDTPASSQVFLPANAFEFLLWVPPESALAGVVAGLGGILGHNFPIWLRFRGGKGIATSTGVLLGLLPLAVGVAAVVWGTAFFVLRYVSVASLVAAATLPLTVGLLWWSGQANVTLFCFSLAASALAFWRHRSNMQRLWEGTEPRSARKAAAAGSADTGIASDTQET